MKDAVLMERVARGEQQAYRDLVTRHLSKIYGLSDRMLGDAAAAEDTTQEAFLRLWRQAQTWRPEARVGTWLYRVIHNLCIDELRRRKKLSSEEVPDRPDPSDGPLATTHRAEVASLVEAEILALPARQKTAITLVHHQEITNIEAADIMGISVDALESLLARGRRTLRRRLEGRKAELMEQL